MLKIFLKCFFSALVIFVAFDFGWNEYLDRKIADNPVYRESDSLIYHRFTNKDIARAPKISTDYYFKWAAGDGSAPADNIIVFNDAIDPAPLREYLRGMGYRQETEVSWDGNESWSNDAHPGVTFFIWQVKERKIIGLTRSVY